MTKTKTHTITTEAREAAARLLEDFIIGDTTNQEDGDPTIWFTGNVKLSELNLIRGGLGLPPFGTAAAPVAAPAAEQVTFAYSDEDEEAKGTVTLNRGSYGPGFKVTAPDGTEYTGYLDMFHFKAGEENCLQIIVDPVKSEEGGTYHARVYPDGTVKTYTEN